VSWEREAITRAINTTIAVPSVAARENATDDARAVLDAYPLPNGPEMPGNLAQLSGAFPALSKLNTLSVRFDGNLTPQHHVFARINRGTSSGDEVNPDSHLPRLSFAHTEATTTKTATFGFTSVLSSAMMHDVRVNGSVNRGSVIASPADYGSAQALPLSLFAPSGASAPDTWVFMRLFLAPGGVLLSGRTSASAFSQFELADTLTYARGRHALRLGVDYRRVTMSAEAAPDRYTYLFRNISSFLNRSVQQLTVEHQAPAEARFGSWAAFVQDTYRISPHFSLDYGIRYSLDRAPRGLDDTQPLLLRYETLPAVDYLPTGSNLWTNGWGHVAPEVGVTYQFGAGTGHETNVRAGWNLTFDQTNSAGAMPFGSGYPYDAIKRVGAATLPVAAADLTATITAPFAPGDSSQYYAFPRDFRSPRTYAWHLGLAQSLGHAQRLGVTYTGNAGRDLVYRQAYDGGILTSPQINLFSNDATADYNALLVEYVRPFTRHFQARLAYTWSHSIDVDAGEARPLYTPNLPAAFLSPSTNRGSADFDRRHVTQVSGSYRVPAPRASTWLRLLCEDWQIDAVATLRSGGPFSVIVPNSNFGFGYYDSRPDLVQGVPLWITDGRVPTRRRLNPDAFVVPEGRQGTLGRNTLQASPLRQLDLSLSRSMRVGERRVAQLRLDAFNVFNLPNFGPPESRIAAGQPPTADFGQPTQSYANALGTGTLQYGGLTPLQQVGGPRSIQVGLRFTF